MGKIAVIGRSDFDTGIGQHTYSFLELLTHNFDNVGFFSTSERDKDAKFIKLPSGRYIQNIRSLSDYTVRIFVDVLKNSKDDYNYKLVEGGALKIAYVVFDSSQVPQEWSNILNSTFDVALAPDECVINAMRNSGVTIPTSTLPLGLDLNSLLRLPLLPPKDIVRFGSLSAFHPRKQHIRLIKAFLNVFPKQGKAELEISSNLNFDNEYEKLLTLRNSFNAEHVRLFLRSMSKNEKEEFLQNIDIYCSASAGEGYSISPREALALGKPLILSETGAHRSFSGVDGVEFVSAKITVPAYFPEIDNMICGDQEICEIDDLSRAIEKTYLKVRNGDFIEAMHNRRWFARKFDFVNLDSTYAEVINSQENKIRKISFPKSEPYLQKISDLAGPYVSKIDMNDRRIVIAHDGGFFSVYNTYVSHLHWDLADPSIRLCLPDWSIAGIRSRFKLNEFTSFCYGRPEDGNIWNKLFIAPFGLATEQLDDKNFLYSRSRNVEYVYNEFREPLLTYKHAYRLYGSVDFQRWRKSYNKTFEAHIRLLPHLQSELDLMSRKIFDGRLVIGAHVRHPSHAIEQDNGSIATGLTYIYKIQGLLTSKFGTSYEKEDWAIFLATDQESVVRLFQREFGERVHYHQDVQRTKVSDDEHFNRLDEAQRLVEGHQIQHLTAKNPDSWSWKMAWEVIRDTYTLAKCDHFLHVTSNISTAVSYINPSCNLVYCES